MLCFWVQMRGSCDPRGYWMARGWRYRNPSLSNAPLRDARVRVCAMHPFLFHGFLARFGILPILSDTPSSPFLSLLCPSWSLVFVPLIFSCPTEHVMVWQPRILLGMVEAQSVNVKNAHRHTHTTVQAERVCPLCRVW